MPVYPGKPGVTRTDKGYQFTVSVPDGEEAFLLLYYTGEKEPVKEITLTDGKKIGNLISVCVDGISPDRYEYNYRIGNEVIQDPYAVYLSGTGPFGQAQSENPDIIRCGFRKDKYRWQDEDFKPSSLADTIIYKLQVREYTMQKNSRVRLKGTFKGLEQKIEYLKNLGATAMLLMPAYDYRETIGERSSGRRGNPSLAYQSSEPTKVNCWGYTGEANYFAPKASFCATDRPVREFSHLVDSLHKAGMECLMEFYFDGSVSPSVMLDILHYWKLQYHVDGFHLMGSGICQEVLVRDALLSRTKLFFHDVDGGYLYRGKEPAYKNVAEYNEGFLYCMRHLLKSDENMLEDFIYRNRRNPKETGIINYLADQDGFTMMDMVSYDEKHNEDNGEDNRDGMEYNCSWNCGTEGQTRKRTVRELRLQQLKNAFLLLLLSQGTPLIFQGDEFGNSQKGNNNAWCQDNEMGWVDWNAFKSNQELYEFVKEAIAFRKKYYILHMQEELKGVDYRALGYPDLSYHGAQAWYAPCERNLRHLGMMYCGDYGRQEKEFLFVAYNLHWMPHDFALPNLPKGAVWKFVVSTSKQEGKVFTEEDVKTAKQKGKGKRSVEVPSRTIAILIGKQETA
ncbi:glycogen operon protein GlgX [Blautia pseudococcoides]|uniref:Glycogen operon protein GlgX n=1 Tax=Blautia pseudococcoides TaxID=1796616 RepID=A0A1C7IGC7_9FIRM|nr:glycogen operon protein GlgX [Blautia pseudococcoides]ASU31705.1 glycogen operon protein GlgX [Blautia pseudococcoides]QQQ95431.1 glycogen operon protein GlgX [Blautia pseudococcoides]